MKRIVIIEDEPFAADHLAVLIERLKPEMTVVAKIPTVKESVQWLQRNTDYDLVFTDIQLADGICFEIFQQVEIPVPVIFTTAYDQYALRAFKVNSVDYLLKPIDKPSLAGAFAKLEALRNTAQPHPILQPAQLQQLMQSMQPVYKQRFAIKIGDHIKLIPTNEVLYFQSQHKITYLITEGGKRYPVQYTLQELEDLLDARQFFRINRQTLLSDRSIQDVAALSNSRLKVRLPFAKESEVVSRERCTGFKEWLDG